LELVSEEAHSSEESAQPQRSQRARSRRAMAEEETISLPRKLVRQIEGIAARQGTSVRAVLEEALQLRRRVRLR